MREQPIFETREKHHGELETFCRVQGHHLHAILPSLGLALAGFEYGVSEEGLERRQLLAIDALRFEATCGRDEFEQVLGPGFAALGFFFAIVFQQATGVDDLIDDFVQGQRASVACQPLDELQEAVHRSGGFGAE